MLEYVLNVKTTTILSVTQNLKSLDTQSVAN